MEKELKKRFKHGFPKNYLLDNPVTGGVTIALFSFFFLLLYRPELTQPGSILGYELTMAVYCTGAGVTAWLSIGLLNLMPLFSGRDNWTIFKEMAAIFIVLFVMGSAVYLLGFITENPTGRLNFTTLFNSFFTTVLIGGIPVFLFTIMNIHHLFKVTISGTPISSANDTGNMQGEPVIIKSPLKKDELRFFPAELIYAESDGNYLNVYLQKDNRVVKKVVRCAISSADKQLQGVPHIIRTHRAFIVNLMKVEEAIGNALGFRLSLRGIEQEIPVSRNRVSNFRKMFEKQE